MNTWDEDFGARFKPLSDKDVSVWTEIISHEIRNLADGELLAAVRTMGERKRKGEFRYTPTVEDLKSAIIFNRWQANQERDGLGSEKCAMCKNTGWLHYVECIESLTNKSSLGTAMHHESGWPQYEMACPCKCSKGIAEMKKRYKPEDHNELLAISEKVMNWIRSIHDDDYYEDQAFAVK